MTKKYTYGLINKGSSYFFLTMSIISVVIGLSFLYEAINWFLTGKELNSSSILFIIVILFLCIVWSPMAFIFMAYLIMDIHADENGLAFQFLWKRYSIKWSELSNIKHIRPFGLFTNKYSHVVIINSELTFIHRLYGLIYGGVYQSAILIHRNISDYDLLIKNISMQVGKNHNDRSTVR